MSYGLDGDRPATRPMPSTPLSRLTSPPALEPRKDVAATKRTAAQDSNADVFIDLYAEGSEYFIKHPGFTLDAAGNAVFSGSLSAATGTFSGTLSAVGGTFGTITAGLLQNSAGTRFIDLSATGTDPFIKHDNFSLLADGTATFSGALSAASGTFAGTVSGSSFTASQSQFSNEIVVGDAGSWTDHVRITDTTVEFRTGGLGTPTTYAYINAPTSGLTPLTITGTSLEVSSGVTAGSLTGSFATETMKLVDAGSTGATEQDWIEVTVGGNTGYIRVFATK